jgi:hypothetical protein
VTTTISAEHEKLASTVAETITDEMRGNYASTGSQPQSVDEGDQNRREHLIKGLREYATPTLRKIISMQNDRHIFWHCAMIDIILGGRMPEDEAFVNDYLHLAQLFTETVLPKRIAQVILTLESFPHYEGLTPQTPGQDYPARRSEQCAAIITLVRQIEASMVRGAIADEHLRIEWFTSEHDSLTGLIEEESDEIIRVIKDERLRHLLVAPDTDLAAVTAIVTERSLVTFEDITHILASQQNNASPALNHGIL